MGRPRSRSRIDPDGPAPPHPTSSMSSGFTAAGAQPPPPDLFILVRPPPSSSNHPLNVQIQLLSPSAARGPNPAAGPSASSAPPSNASGPTTPVSTGGMSFDAVAGASVAQSPRAAAAGAEAADGAAADSGSDDDATSDEQRERRRSRSPSISSTRSGTSGESAVTGTTSTSGGSGFRRKVIPLLNLSYHTVLSTTVQDAGTEARVAKFAKRGGIELPGLAIFDPLDLAAANAAAAAKRSASPSPTALTAPPAKADSGASNLFSKFSRLSLRPSTAPSSSASRSTDASASTAAPSPLALIRTPSPPDSSPDSSSPYASGRKRRDPGYAFVLRKWLRSDLAEAPRTIRLEWVRAPPRRRRKARSGEGSAPGSRRGSAQAEAGELTNVGGNTAMAVEVEEEEEEEEERAWVCSLVYPLSTHAASPLPSPGPNGPSASAHSTPAPSPPLSTASSASPGLLTVPTSPASSNAPVAAPSTRRISLATLRPAPHHPRLVSTLLLPPSLPSIPLGSFHPSRGLVGGALGPEELRDLAMVTALWVAVREGLGGLEDVVRAEASGGGGGAATLAGRESAAPPGSAAVEGFGALTEKAGLAIQGLAASASAGSGGSKAPATGGTAGAKRKSGAGAAFSRLFGGGR
ncbi:hypothetical protein Rhopal_006911-T1 [Rhodotorula paludigena]|uniref:Uncharacterized protein n=1 Tax=Rhodotorula paludigena TaxID=86838 RepID=A0AAV5GWY8_9BASI|nr:hypothetical protein Rhopal_006911-T1 [Rhodotorula paludigena]